MKRLTRILAAAAAACSITLALSACNTTKGLGRDIEKAGDGIERSADRNGAD